MAHKLYDLAVKVGEYNDAQGNKKGRYQNVGVVMQGDDGNQFIMLAKWFNPAGVPDLSGRGGESVLVSCFAPKGQAPQQQDTAPRSAPAAPAPPPAPTDFEDDIPF